MNKRIIFSCVSAFLTGILTAWYLIVRSEQNLDQEKCTANAVIYYKDIRANLELDFMYSLHNMKGILSISGIYYKNNSSVGPMRNDVSYIWTENKNNFIFTSLKVDDIIENKNITDDMMSNTLPDFYFKPGETISYNIVKQGKKGFLFTVGKRPIFICSR